MNKRTTFAAVAGIVLAAGILSAAGKVEPAPDELKSHAVSAVDNPYETLPVIDAYYEGKTLRDFQTRASKLSNAWPRPCPIHATLVSGTVITSGVRTTP